jgi:Trypsin
VVVASSNTLVGGTARVEQRHARNQVLHALASGCAAATLVASVGCWQPTQRTLVAVPAARRQDEGRPLRILPPFELMEPRDAIVRIVGAGDVTCTGTLVADDRVLTAHHCVSMHDARGHVQSRDMAPEDIQVELGGDDLPWGEVKVRAIVAPQCGFVSGEGDIAILVLERPLIGMPIYAPRLESAPEPKDDISIFGFGRCALSPGAIHRRAREATKIDSVEPGLFRASASICPGDSGGPVQSSKGDLIGVVSASVMDGDDQTSGASVFTRLDPWRQLFAAAHEISLGASRSELPPYGDCRPAAPRPPAR